MKILQISTDCEIVNEWDSVLEIAKHFNKARPGFDQALRKGYKSRGYFWMYKKDWDNGNRPDFGRQVRNMKVYIYKPIRPEEHIYLFLGEYKNAVEAAYALDISVSNIRVVAQNDKDFHKGYYFSYSPIDELEVGSGIYYRPDKFEEKPPLPNLDLDEGLHQDEGEGYPLDI